MQATPSCVWKLSSLQDEPRLEDNDGHEWNWEEGLHRAVMLERVFNYSEVAEKVSFYPCHTSQKSEPEAR